MANDNNYYVVSGETLSQFAEALRVLDGTSQPLEWFNGFAWSLMSIAGKMADIQPLNVTQNGTYTAPSGTAYSPVTVNVSGSGGTDTLEQRATNTLTSYTNANISRLAASTFQGCTNLQSVSLSNATGIEDSAFKDCTSLTTASVPSAKTIGGNAFSGCQNLETLSIGTIEDIKSYAFYNCKELNVPITYTGQTLPNYSFYGCEKLTSISLSNVKTMNSYALYNCKALTSVSLPALTGALPQSGFYGCTNLTNISLNPNYAVTTSSDCFNGCTSLQVVDLQKATSISSRLFQGCTSLNTIVLRKNSAIATLGNINAFTNTPFASGGSGGTLYVPNDLIASYQSASNWSTILGYPNNQIKKIEGSIYE